MADNVKPCPGCKPHAYQDEKYGKGVRVFTIRPEGKVGRCTVCGKDK
jgi:hypothetical protein